MPSPETQAVFKPDRAVSERAAQRKHRGRLEGDEGAFPILAVDRGSPGGTEFGEAGGRDGSLPA